MKEKEPERGETELLTLCCAVRNSRLIKFTFPFKRKTNKKSSRLTNSTKNQQHFAKRADGLHHCFVNIIEMLILSALYSVDS
jgi:hypothetical protein